MSVVVDVLTFTTTVSVAADRGATVLPYAWGSASAAAFAQARGATLAVTRADCRPGDVSLSPETVRRAPPLVALVLPSPNGSSISASLARSGRPVVAASLRNRRAVARWLVEHLGGDPDATVLVVPAGERWPDDSLRPAVEDLWGAGGVVAALQDLGADGAGDGAEVGEEAAAAAAAYRLVEGRLEEAMRRTLSGRELTDMGCASDVTIAAELDSSALVPVLEDGAFVGRRAQ